MPRQAPSESATKFPVGHTQKGQDGHMWKIVAVHTKHGVVQRWQRTDSGKKVASFAWNALFGNKVFHYRAKMMSKLSPQDQRKWHEFLECAKILVQEGIAVIIVPRAFDYQHGQWWADYIGAYANQFFPLPKDQPYLHVVIDVDAQGYYTHIRKNDIIYIYHDGIKRAVKEKLLRILGHHTWFKWDGKDSKAMQLDI